MISVRIINIDPRARGEDLKAICDPYGVVIGVKMVAPAPDGDGLASAVVAYSDPDDAKEAAAFLMWAPFRGHRLSAVTGGCSTGTNTQRRRAGIRLLPTPAAAPAPAR